MFIGTAFWSVMEEPTPSIAGLTYGRWVTIRTTGTLQRAAWSDDGITWNVATTPDSLSYKAVDFSPELGLYVAVAETSSGVGIMSSTNGVAWTQRTAATTAVHLSINWCPAWQKFIVMGAPSSAPTSIVSYESSDGINWSTQSRFGTTEDFYFNYRGAYATGASPSLSFALTRKTDSVAKILYTTDGGTWASYSMPQSPQTFRLPRKIVYSAGSNKWMVVAQSDPTVVAISSTISSSTSWQYNTTANVSGGVRFSCEVNDNRVLATSSLFVISTANDQTTTTPMKYSSTGTTGSWTFSNFPSGSHLVYDIQYAPEINQWLYFDYNSTNAYISRDAASWSAVTGVLNALNSVFAPGVRTNGYKQGA